MHSFHGPSGESFFHYSGDLSGDMIINNTKGSEVKVPAHDVIKFFLHLVSIQDDAEEHTTSEEKLLRGAKRS